MSQDEIKAVGWIELFAERRWDTKRDWLKSCCAMTDAIARGFYLSNDIKYPNWKEGAGNGISAAVIPTVPDLPVVCWSRLTSTTRLLITFVLFFGFFLFEAVISLIKGVNKLT